jgi:hypothetical protein
MPADPDPDTPKRSKKDTREFLEESRKRFQLSAEAETELREASLKDDRFRAGDHWPAAIKQQRESEGRPCLEIDKLSQPIRQVTNQERQARPAIQINPVGAGADQASAEIRQGLIRQIEQHSYADVAYDWAFDGAVSRGWGYFRVLTEYEDDTSFDQVLKIDWIENAYTVFFDPSARGWNKADAMWCHVIEDLTKEAYDARYGGKKGRQTAASLGQFTGLGTDQPTWFPDGGIRICEYFYVELEDEILALLEDGSVVPKDQVPTGTPILKTRKAQKRVVKWCLHNALEILDEGEWAGKYIPIVEVEGERIIVNGKRIKRGLIRAAQDPQRMYDYWISTATETTALAPRAPWIMYEGQDEGYEAMWAQANTKSFSSLKVRATTTRTGNQVLPLPQRILAEPPIQAMMAGIRQSELDIHSVTAFFDASDPRRAGSEQSGKAVLARKEQGNQTNLNFIDNFGRSLRYLGQILLDLLPKIYDRPGRVIEIIGIDDEMRQVMLKQPFQKDQDGKPQPLDEGTAFVQGMHEFYSLDEGQYDATVTVGASYTTRRQEAVVSMLQLVEANPAMAPMMADVLVENMDWPGAPQLAERLKKMLPPQLQEEQKGGQKPPTPQEAAAQQQMQGLQAELQKAQQIIQTDQVKAQAGLQEAQMKAQLEIQLQEMKNAATIAVAHIAANAKGASLAAHADEEALALGHEANQAAQDRQHEMAMTAAQHAAQQAQQAQQAAQQPQPEQPEVQ